MLQTCFFRSFFLLLIPFFSVVFPLPYLASIFILAHSFNIGIGLKPISSGGCFMNQITVYKQKKRSSVLNSSSFVVVIPLGFEPKTHSLEGCCYNPTELRNHHLLTAKVVLFIGICKFPTAYLYFFNNASARSSPKSLAFCRA